MPARFFKSTDGHKTWFRKTGNPLGFGYGYRTLSGSYLGFTNAAVVSKANTFPAVEIDAAEYKALVAFKKARVEAAGRDNLRDSSPQDAWVSNEALARAEAAEALDDFNYVGSRHHY